MKTNIDKNDEDINNQMERLNPASVNDYSYYKEITILASQVSGSGSHLNFPVLISLSDTDLRDQCQADGDDIAFYSGTTLLDYEIEDYDGNTGNLVAWVRIPSLSTSTNTIIRMYYGNSSLGSSEANSSGVWNNDFQGVWHLRENTGEISRDSTSNAFNGNSQGNPISQEGKIGNAQEFDGNGDYIETSKSASEFGIEGANIRTASMWVKAFQMNNRGGIFDIGTCQTNQQFGIRAFSDNAWRCQFWGDDFQFSHTSLDTWVYLSMCYDGSTVRVYADGVEKASSMVSLNTTDTNPLRIGVYLQNTIYYSLNGIVDEMRISNTTRSTGWILTEYRNQNDPSSFYTVRTNPDYDPMLPTNPPDMMTFSMIIIAIISAFVIVGIFGSVKKISKNKSSKSSPYWEKNYIKKYGKKPYSPSQNPEDVDICISTNDLFINRSNVSSELDDIELIEMKKIRITCPICKTQKSISVPRVILKRPGKLTTMDVPKESICAHQFQLYVDNNCTIRGYQKVDYQISTDLKNDNEKWKEILNLSNEYENKRD